MCHPPLNPPPPLKSEKYRTPLFRRFPPQYWFFHDPPRKNRIFQWNPKIFPKVSKNIPKSFSSLTPSYLSKITKFLVKVSQSEFFVMTEKNIFVSKLFLSLNFQIFIFYVKITTLPRKDHPLFSTKPFLKIKVLSSPPFWKFGWRFNPSPGEREGVQTMIRSWLCNSNWLFCLFFGTWLFC